MDSDEVGKRWRRGGGGALQQRAAFRAAHGFFFSGQKFASTMTSEKIPDSVSKRDQFPSKLLLFFPFQSRG
jgi:hypothetical protein